MESGHREHALRIHIRSRLLDYSLTHLATNYVTWTQDAVTELLSNGLSFVPTTDPTDPLLPVDPQENLLRIWKLDSIEPYNETWKSNAQVLQFIKAHCKVPGWNERPTKTCWDLESDADHDLWFMLRPVSPVLSRASIRQTPKLGSLNGARLIPHSWQEMLSPNNLKPVLSEDLPEEPPPKLQDVLDLKLTLDTQTHKGMTALFKVVSVLAKRSVPSDVHEVAKDFLRTDSPPVELPQLASPPIFPRDRRPGNKLPSGRHSNQAGPIDIKDLSSIVPAVTPEKDDEDEELDKQHMVVVDGWQAYTISSSPPGTPSLGDSSSEVDELFLPSPSEHGRSFIEDLMVARLEEHEMPRSQNIGGTQEKPKALGHGQTLSGFLSTLRHRRESSLDQAKIVTTPKSQPSSPHTAITASMLGQPPTVRDGDDEHTMRCKHADPPSEGSDTDTDVILKRIYDPHLAIDDITQLVLNEKLDERDCLLMDVPVMPPPNEHSPTAMFLPDEVIDLLALTKTKHGQADNHVASVPLQIGYLRKVKGTQALNIELSWIPFKFGSSIPTDAEVSGVAGRIGDTLTAELQREFPGLVGQLTEIFDDSLRLQECDGEEHAAPSTLRSLDDTWDLLDCGSLTDEVADVDIILTRGERMTLRGSSGVDEELGSSDKENDELVSTPFDPDEAGPPLKRARTTEEQDGFCAGDLDGEIPTTDDSGVFLSSSEAMPRKYVRGFAELDYAAQGFEGSNVDGNLFADIDPVHEIGFTGAATTYAAQISPRGAYSHSYRASGMDDLQRPLPWEYTRVNANESWPPPSTLRLGQDHAAGQEAPRHPVRQRQNLTLADSDSRMPRTTVSLTQPSSTTTKTRAHPAMGGPTIGSTDLMKASPKHPATLPSARRSLSEFLTLVGKKDETAALDPGPPEASQPTEEEKIIQTGEAAPGHIVTSTPVPAELLDSNTFCLPQSGLRPVSMHRYMTSVALLQKRVLVRCLASDECCVDLIEREDLGDADLVLDPDTVVSFTSLAALPAHVDAVLARLAGLSWRYSHILVVFECYPNSLSFKRDLASPRAVPYPFSAAVMKAVKKLRRDLNIAEACQTMRTGSTIRFAFAVSVEEAASYARRFGDEAEAHDTTHGALWGAREWLDFDEQEGETDLAGVDGMNPFAASIILSQMSLDDFLDTSPEDRAQYFGPYVGYDRLARFNEELARRAQAVHMTSSSPPA